MIVDELVGILKFDFNDKNLKKFDKGMQDAVKVLAGVVTAAVAASTAITAFIDDVAQSTDKMGKQAQMMGVSVEAFQELAHSAELNGSSQETLASSLTSVAKAASEAARGVGGGIEAFGILGISVTDANGNIKQTDQLLLDVADSLQGVSSQSEKIELLSKLGISEDLLLTLDQGSDAIRRQMQEARDLGFVLSKEAAKASADFVDEQTRVTKALKGVSNQIAVGLLPSATKTLTMFKEWFMLNRDLIKQNLERFMNGLTSAINTVFNIGVRVVSVIDKIAQGLGGWENVLIAAATAWALLNANMLLVPLLAIAAATGIFLLIEDLITFAEGGDSAIQSLIDKFPFLEAPIRGLISIIKMVAEGWGLIFTDGSKAIEGLGILIDKWLIEPFDKLLESINSFTEGIGSFFSGELKIGDAFDKVGSLFSGELKTGDAFDKVGSFFGNNEEQGAPTGLTPTVGSQNNLSNSQSVTANITVNAGGVSGSDGKQIAITVREEVQKVISDNNTAALRNLKGMVAL